MTFKSEKGKHKTVRKEKDKMKITALILNILCALIYGIATLISEPTPIGIIALIATMIWSVNVGLIIARLISDKHPESER